MYYKQQWKDSVDTFNDVWMDKGYSESSPPFCYFRLSSSDYIVYK